MAGDGEVIRARLRTPRVRALARQRVDGLLDRAWDHRLTLVIAPPGSGKTTAIAQLAERSSHPVAWYRAEGADGDASRLLAHVERALTDALTGLLGGWDSAEDAARSLEQWPGGRAALLIDDLHTLRGSGGEQVLAQLIDYVPPQVCVVAATRVPPAFDLSRLRLSGELLEVSADDLRFRTWEAEQLFRDVYGTLLPPEHLAQLTRRVEGWAAGLQLYHLAARSRPPEEQRRLIEGMHSRSRLAREYLTRNVLDALAQDVRTFLVDTCVLGTLDAPLCDRLTGRTDSAAVLHDLERQQLFTIPLDDEGSYRYHEVLRAHLEALLVERDGEAGARARFRRAGVLYEDAGLPAEALRCYGRALDRHALGRLLDRGTPLPSGLAWLDALPAAMVGTDPWLLLARARGAVAAGQHAAALADYQEAERVAGSTSLADTCRTERQALLSWLDPSAPAPGGWTSHVRRATRFDPVGVATSLAGQTDPTTLLARGGALLAGGMVRDARALFEAVLQHRDTGGSVAATARLALAAASLLADEPGGRRAAEDAESAAERVASGWLARLARASLALTGNPGEVAAAARVAGRCTDDGDRWGAALARLAAGLGALRAGLDARAPLTMAAERFQALDAPALEALARAAHALWLARAGDAEAPAAARAAERQARQVQSPGARALALAAMAVVSADHADAARAAADECGLMMLGAVPAPATMAPAPPVPPRPPIPAVAGAKVRCFGTFELTIAGKAVDLASVRPRARSAMRLLALHAGRPVHREVLVEALWPGADPDSALRNLQVALSSLRQALPSGSGVSIVRDGDAYRLALPDGGERDITEFERGVAAARASKAASEWAEAAAAAGRALALYGEVLVEEGPAEWVQDSRAQYRSEAVAVAALGAEAAIAAGDPAAAAAIAERGLQADRYADGLWNLCISALEAAGEPAKAARVRRTYDEVMRELDVAG